MGNKQIKVEILNATEKSFAINYVDENCRESPSNQMIDSGRKTTITTYNGHAFRVREAGTNKLLEVVVADPSKPSVTIGSVTAANVKIGAKPTVFELVKDPNPMQGFLRTLNSVRKARNLPPMQLDNALNQACQWHTDLMAKYNKMGHDAVVIGGSQFADMQHPWFRVKKFNYKGDGGTEAAGMVDGTDISTVGGSAILQWAMSNTHYRPFLSMDGQIFKNVGFGFTKSNKEPGMYWTCAVFGNPNP